MDFNSALDKMIAFFTSSEFREEVLLAKKDFFEQAGIIDEESHHFEARMSQFLDWYIFSRPLTKYHLPPASLVVNTDLYPISEKDRPLYESLSDSIHSLFEFIKVRGADVYVYDLFAKKKYILKDSEVRIGFNPQEVFDARIIPFKESMVFSRGFCFHPAEAKKFILKEIKKIRHLEKEHHESLMFKLLKMRYKLEQYRHIKLEYIYTNDPQIKI